MPLLNVPLLPPYALVGSRLALPACLQNGLTNRLQHTTLHGAAADYEPVAKAVRPDSLT